MAVQTHTTDGFSAGPAAPLFDIRIEGETDSLRNYDVTHDGKRFLMIKDDESISVPQVTIVENWFADLKKVQ
jgi:hypothetical protein